MDWKTRKRMFIHKLVRSTNYEEFPWIANKVMEVITQYKYQNSWEVLYDSILHINEKYVDKRNMVYTLYIYIYLYMSYNLIHSVTDTTW